MKGMAKMKMTIVKVEVFHSHPEELERCPLVLLVDLTYFNNTTLENNNKIHNNL